MPRVLHKLRVDEISSCDRGAGEGTRITLYKRGEAAPEKQGDTNMNITKALRAAGEVEFTKMVTRYAKSVHPDLSAPQAFSKVFLDDSDEGRAIRWAWATSKGVVPADSADREYGSPASRGYTSEALDDDEAADEGEGVVDDALEELEELAADAKRRDPRLSKAQSFAKAYADNPELAAKERRQNRPRAV